MRLSPTAGAGGNTQLSQRLSECSAHKLRASHPLARPETFQTTGFIVNCPLMSIFANK